MTERPDSVALQARGRVAYEAVYDNTKAARLRVFEAILNSDGAISRAAVVFDSISVLVWLAPACAPAFEIATRPVTFQYASPTRFDGRGTIRPVYATPEAELDARAAFDVLARDA